MQQIYSLSQQLDCQVTNQHVVTLVAIRPISNCMNRLLRRRDAYTTLTTSDDCAEYTDIVGSTTIKLSEHIQGGDLWWCQLSVNIISQCW